MDGAKFDDLLFETKDQVAVITINRPDRRNAIRPQTSVELSAAFRHFDDDNQLRVAILTGAGDKAFCSGADLAGMSDDRIGRRLLPAVPFGGITGGFETWKPIIAAINGYCLAGGLELALSCDFRIAAEHASFGFPEPKLGMVPAAGGTQRLPRAVPLAFALELLLTGERIDAKTAHEFGLISKVVPLEELLPSAENIARRILECGPLAVRAIKQATLRGLDLSLAEGLKLERELANEVLQTEDAKEGSAAFAERRPPLYKGR
jgi:E-phenylitaconyl-CoA hydratase